MVSRLIRGTFTRQETLVLKDQRIYHLCPATGSGMQNGRFSL